MWGDRLTWFGHPPATTDGRYKQRPRERVALVVFYILLLQRIWRRERHGAEKEAQTNR